MKKSIFLFLILLFTNNLCPMSERDKNDEIILQSNDGSKHKIQKNIACVSPYICSLINQNDKYTLGNRFKNKIINIGLSENVLLLILPIIEYCYKKLNHDLRYFCIMNLDSLEKIKSLYFALSILKFGSPWLDKWVIEFLYNFFNKNKKCLEAFLKELPKDAAINLAKQYFYWFGRIKLRQSDEERNKQFLNINLHYTFSLKELIDYRKIPAEYISFSSSCRLNLNSLKLKDLEFLPLIPGINRVEKLNLSNNNLTAISPNSFNTLKCLKKINLANNPLENLPDIFVGQDLKKLKVNFNFLDQEDNINVDLDPCI